MITAPAPLRTAVEAPLPRSIVELVNRCDGELLAARLASDPSERFTHGHLAALRVAGAVLTRVSSKPTRGRPRSAWQRLASTEPSLASWATYFESGARLRAAVDAGRTDVVTDELADRWVAAAEDFRDVVCLYLGMEPDDATSARAS